MKAWERGAPLNIAASHEALRADNEALREKLAEAERQRDEARDVIERVSREAVDVYDRSKSGVSAMLLMLEEWKVTKAKLARAEAALAERAQTWQPEVCICAAIQFPSGQVVYGHRHDDCLRTAGAMVEAGHLELRLREAKQGFVTTRHRFVSREEAARLQREAGIKSKDANRIEFPTALFSEDLYRGAATLPLPAPPAGEE